MLAKSASTHFKLYAPVLFGGLTCTGLARRHPRERRKHLSHAQPYIRFLERLARKGAVNVTVMLQLLKAEVHSCHCHPAKDCVVAVEKEYAVAMELADEIGFPLIKAIACERLGLYLMSNDRHANGASHLRNAVREVRFETDAFV